MWVASDWKSNAGYETGYQYGAGGSRKTDQLLYQSEIILGNDWLCVAGKRRENRVALAGASGGAWNPTGNMPVENMRRKRGSVMERKELQYIPIRSQSQQRVRELAARLYRSDAQRLFWFRVAVGCAAVTAVATGAMMAIAQSASVF